MPDYSVRFIGLVNEKMRPDDFPKKVSSQIFARVGSLHELQDAINEEMIKIIRQNGLIVPKDDSVETLGALDLDRRQFIPMHMLVSIFTETKKLASDIPDMLNPDGLDDMPRNYQQ